MDLTPAANIDFGSGKAATAYGDLIQSPAASIFSTPFTVLLTVGDDEKVPSETVLTEPVFDYACSLGKALAAGVPGIVVPSLQGVSLSINYFASPMQVVCRNL